MEGVTNQLLSVLDQLEHASNRLFTSISTNNNSNATTASSSTRPSPLNTSTTTPTTTTTTFQSLSQTNSSLQQILSIYKNIHKPQQDQIDSLVLQIEENDKEWDRLIGSLVDAKLMLEKFGVGKRWEEEKKQMERALENPLSPMVVVNYAKGLTTHASTNLLSATTEDNEQQQTTNNEEEQHQLPGGIRLPFPTEDMIRRGRLGEAAVDQDGNPTSQHQIIGEAKPIQPSPVPQTVIQQQPSHHVQQQYQESFRRQAAAAAAAQEDDFSFDLDLNPDF